MIFDVPAVLCIGIGCLILGGWLNNRYRSKPTDREVWWDGFTSGLRMNRQLDPPRFIGEDDNEQGASPSADPLQ